MLFKNFRAKCGEQNDVANGGHASNEHGETIHTNAKATRWLADRGYDKKMGARPLARIIDNEIKSPLSRRVLFGDLVNGGRVTVDIVDDKLDFTVVEIPKPLTKEERKALRAQKLAEAAKVEDNVIAEDQTNES